MSTTRKTKSVSFDKTDGFELSLLAHAEKIEKGKFSRYIKRLIADDLKGRSFVAPAFIAAEPEEPDEVSTEGFL